MSILEQLGVFGWKQKDETLLLASLLTGDPLLMIGNAGSAKTHVANKIAQALQRKYLAYDASKCMFEDVLGYPDIEKLKQGVIEYVPSPVTIWDKEIVLIDELNRAVPELQSKWMEIIRSHKLMGFNTNVRWVFAAMNPLTYSATQALDEALIGRFAFFIYPPDVLQMDERDRIRVATHINGDDAPSLSEWTNGISAGTVSTADVTTTGERMRQILTLAAVHFLSLREQMTTLAEFLAKFADLLMRETKGEVALDGRRLGFIYRNLLSNRALELAKAEILQTPVPDFVTSARYVIQSSIPIGLNNTSIKRDEATHKMEICFDLLSTYFTERAELNRVNLIYELFTTPDLMRKAELLLTHDLGELALSKAWTDLMAEDRDITLLAYTALQVEARRPGTIPQELFASLSAKVAPGNLASSCVPNLENDAIEYIDDVNCLLDRESDLAKLIAYQRVRALVVTRNINPRTIRETERAIHDDLDTFERLLDGVKTSSTEGEAA
jgi:hypothetical protein